MSHRVEVGMIADQEIDINGKRINVHDIEIIVVDGNGLIVEFFLKEVDGDTA